MPKRRTPESGIILLLVLSIVLVVIILSGVVLTIISNQSRLTHHQVSRIKAYYACKGAMNYALDQLRQGNWASDPVNNRYACFNNCSGLGVPAPTYSVNDPDMPNILITIYPVSGNGRIDIKTDYTYTS